MKLLLTFRALSLCGFAFLWGVLTSAMTISDDLQLHDNSRIQVRGFLYSSRSNEQMILSSQPNLKSCCVGDPHLSNQQLMVVGLSSQNYGSGVVTLEGILRVSNHETTEGTGTKKYILEDAIIISPSNPLSRINLLLIAGLGLVTVIGAYTFYVRKRETK